MFKNVSKTSEIVKFIWTGGMEKKRKKIIHLSAWLLKWLTPKSEGRRNRKIKNEDEANEKYLKNY